MAKTKNNIKEQFPLGTIFNPNMEVSKKLITPEIAAELLKKNSSNRPLAENVVRRYTKIIQEGLWQINGDPIRMSITDKLLDGQHKLMAICKTGVTIEMPYIEGLEDSAFCTIDTGKKRTGADTLYIAGYKSCMALAGACRVVYCIVNASTINANIFRTKISNDEILNVIREHPDIYESLNTISTHYKEIIRLLSSHSAATALHYLFYKKDPTLCTEYFYQLNWGEGLFRDSVVYQLRELLKSDYASLSSIHINDKMTLLIRVWNHLRKGEHNINFIVNNNEIIKEIL